MSAYQTSGFAYQGSDQFAYQGVAVTVATASSPYVGPMGRFRTGLWPLPHIADRGPTPAEDSGELEEMVRLYADWTRGRP